MQTRGPEGEQEVRDKKNNPVESGMRVTYKGYHEYVRYLLGEAGIIDPEVEALVEKWRKEEEKMAAIERRMGTITS